MCVLLCLICTGTLWAQESEPVTFSRNVFDSSGDPVDGRPPQVTFTVYLNGDVDHVLTEEAPRRDGQPASANLTLGSFSVELSNFPSLSAGDTVTVRLTDNTVGEQGVLSAVIDRIPWSDAEPFISMQLEEPGYLPPAPTDLSLTVGAGGERTLEWSAEDSLTYSVYRRALEDQRFDGIPRRVYARIAEGISGGTFTDDEPAADSTFGYIVYAHSPSGVTSSHSIEVVETLQISGLAATASARNATLTWDAFDVPVGETMGYVIYRAEGDDPFGAALAYTGPETQYTDTRLEPGITYRYKVRARNERLQELGDSEELSVTTEKSTARTYTYASLKTAVVLYRNAIHRKTGQPYVMSDKEVADIKFLLEQSREFFWRNSGMKLNMEFTYYEINELIDFEGAGSAASTRITGQHLQDMFGIVNTQYDLVYRITPSTGGFFSWGATDLLNLPGPERRTGFSQNHFPLRSERFSAYPGDFPNVDVDFSQVWLFIHEAQHAVDGIYRWNGQLAMGHGDFPELYGNPNIRIGEDPGYPAGDYPPGYPSGWGTRFGKRFDFQATMLRDFIPYYEELLSNWGNIYETADEDEDGFPDADPRVPLDEERFGSAAAAADTDGDSYSDKEEAMDGIYPYSVADPSNVDTDGDGRVDGEDLYPRYPISESIKRVEGKWKPAIDGDVGDWPSEALIGDAVTIVTKGETFSPKLYMAYDSDSLYLAFNLPKLGVPTVKFDFEADGRWYGAGNTNITFNVSRNSFSTFRSWDASPDVEEYLETEKGKKSGAGMWDDSGEYQNEFKRRVVSPASVNLAIDLDLPRVRIEMAIPRNEFAGLTLQPGDTLGFLVDYTNVDQTTRAEATTFDQWSYVYLPLSSEAATATEAADEVPITYELEQNHPNPFNPSTAIRFALPKAADVELAVYDVMGRRVRTLFNGRRAAGRYEVTWDGTTGGGNRAASGMYFYRLQTSTGQSFVRQMILLK